MRVRAAYIASFSLLVLLAVPAFAQTDVAHLAKAIHVKARALENSSGMRSSFQSFTAAYRLRPEAVNYSDYVLARLIYESARDAGFWNLHWTITNQEPNSDQIWKQWKSGPTPSYLKPTASAECDELSALYAFLMRRVGIREVGLLWPYPNHTVAVWVITPKDHVPVRVVVPTSQIFLDVTDSFATRKFDPWRQKSIHEYVRRDVPDTFVLPGPLFDFFLAQIDKYGGASDSTLQQIRYLREGVFLKYWTPEAAAQSALQRRAELKNSPPEDLAAFYNFAQDMRTTATR